MPTWLSEAMRQLGGRFPISIDPMVFPLPDPIADPYSLPETYNGLELLFDEPGVADQKTVLAFTVQEDLYFDWQAKYGDLTKSRANTVEDLSRKNWEFLGYDVADMPGMISGITNCGFKTEDVDNLKAQNLFHVNANSLIDAYETASAFAKIRSEQIPSHAPFRVIGVWRKK